MGIVSLPPLVPRPFEVFFHRCLTVGADTGDLGTPELDSSRRSPGASAAPFWLGCRWLLMAVTMTWAGLDFPSSATLMKSSCICHELVRGEGRESAEPLGPSESLIPLWVSFFPGSQVFYLPSWLSASLPSILVESSWLCGLLEQRGCLGRDGSQEPRCCWLGPCA